MLLRLIVKGAGSMRQAVSNDRPISLAGFVAERHGLRSRRVRNHASSRSRLAIGLAAPIGPLGRIGQASVTRKQTRFLALRTMLRRATVRSDDCALS